MSNDKITEIPVRFKRKQGHDKKMLTLVRQTGNKCFPDHSYVIDEEAEKVTCKNCDKVFNPMSVLVKLARKESRWMMNAQDYQDRMKRLSKKKRTKCVHCKQFTPIREK